MATFCLQLEKRWQEKRENSHLNFNSINVVYKSSVIPHWSAAVVGTVNSQLAVGFSDSGPLYVEFACPFCACMACILCRYYGFLQQSKDMHIRLIGSSQLVVGCFYVATFQNETPPLPADSCGRLQLHPVTLTAGELVTENDLKIKSFSYNDVALFGTKEPIRGLMSLR